MMTTATTKLPCELCGAPAIVHVRPSAADETMLHFCISCADQRGSSADQDAKARGINPAALYGLAGLTTIVLSTGADVFAFGRADGFGWKQMAGVVCGAALTLTGALLRTRTILLAGVIMAGLTLVADWVGLGASPGFGWRQGLGCVLGALLLLKARSARKTGEPEPPPRTWPVDWSE